jgi:hypothetical protein
VPEVAATTTQAGRRLRAEFFLLPSSHHGYTFCPAVVHYGFAITKYGIATSMRTEDTTAALDLDRWLRPRLTTLRELKRLV